MIDFKKMDDKDFVFISKPLSKNDDKAFSDFLKNRKSKPLRRRTDKKRKKLQPQQARTAYVGFAAIAG